MAKPGSQDLIDDADVTAKAIIEDHDVVGDGMFGRRCKGSGETWLRVRRRQESEPA